MDADQMRTNPSRSFFRAAASRRDPRAARIVAALALGLTLSLPAFAASTKSAPAKSETHAANASAGTQVGGIAPEEWTVRWWRWAHSFPDGLTPYQDTDGSRCAMGQDEDGPVWFLAGTDGRFDAKRGCQVPLGKHLLIPLINLYTHTPRDGKYATTCAALKAQVAVSNRALASAVILIDGKPLPPPVRLISRCFDPFAAQRDSGPEHDAQSRHHAAADGYWALLPPLPPGKHRLVVGANYGTDKDQDYGRMIQNFEYELQIGDPAI
ncbi:hypothetical protein [Lysobacter gummosus]|uniref:hypothetical protein n=1 Tax=Lysobacter gummosus TaxID=262324 RepID=UPI0036DEBB59